MCDLGLWDTHHIPQGRHSRALALGRFEVLVSLISLCWEGLRGFPSLLPLAALAVQLKFCQEGFSGQFSVVDEHFSDKLVLFTVCTHSALPLSRQPMCFKCHLL